MSGVTVATMIMSISSAVTSASANAAFAASLARSAAVSFEAAMRLSFIPVRVVIHSSRLYRPFFQIGVCQNSPGRARPTPQMPLFA